MPTDPIKKLRWTNGVKVLQWYTAFLIWDYIPNPTGTVSQSDHEKQAVLPGGRNSGQKAQKGPQKKKFVAEFWLILPKTGRKGAAENFQNKFLIFSCWPNFLDVLAGNFFGTWQHCTQLGFAVPARPADLPQGGGGGQRKRLNSGVQLCVSADIISLFHH